MYTDPQGPPIYRLPARSSPPIKRTALASRTCAPVMAALIGKSGFVPCFFTNSHSNRHKWIRFDIKWMYNVDILQMMHLNRLR